MLTDVHISPSDFMEHLAYMMVHINELHYSYLYAHESLQKLEEKKRLEGHIKEYLMIAPHEKKFCYRETGLILHKSAELKEHFSGIRASAAWTAIAAYAHNLLAQSWRKEFRQIKTYSGFFKHNVETGLVGSELMLMLMGYRDIGNGIFVLEGPVDPDRVTNVSRDSLVALVECQVLSTLYADLLKAGCNLSWLDIVQYRETHPSTTEQALHGLMFQYTQRYCRPDVYPTKFGIMPYPLVPSMSSPYYRPPGNVPTPYYNVVSDSYQFSSPAQLTNPVNNSYSRYPTYPNNFIPNPPSSQMNVSVPTAQLIELDTPYSKDETDNYQRHLLDKNELRCNPLKLNESSTNLTKSKYDSDVGWETWGATASGFQVPGTKKSSKFDPASETKLDEWEALKALTIDDPQPSCSKSDPKLQDKIPDKVVKKKAKPETSGSLPNSSQTIGRDEKKTDINYTTLKVKLSDKWECLACTFHNANDKDVCEMCSKSRNAGNEVQPLVSGGRQCPKCTLVNEKGVTVCDACGTNLKDSPTYI